MLHEDAQVNSATRTFRNKPVLDWTLQRLSRAKSIDRINVLCWDDQLDLANAAVQSCCAIAVSKGERQNLPGMAAITTARRWADGWRGGLLGTCDFDLGFHPQWAQEITQTNDAEVILLVDPSAGLIDPVLIERLIEHAENHPSAELCFTQAAPGLTGTLLRKSLVDRLTIAKIHPGRLLTYWPDQHGLDPTGKQGCAPVPTPVARSIHRFTLDSHRQIDRLNHDTVSLNGHLIATEAEELAHRMKDCETADVLPRQVVLELNVARACQPVYWPGSHLKIDRPDLSLGMAQQIFAELSVADDLRLTLGGVGDPMLHPLLFEIIAAARQSGIRAINVETDLLTQDTAMLERLAESGVDIISVQFPAATAKTYAQLMNVNGFARVLENIRLLEIEVTRVLKGTPLIVPFFVKMPTNLAEMEAWYDYWIRRLGHAVITGPSDYAGQIPDTAVADMAPPKRRPCARLASRMTILSDGRIVSCEQDILGKQVMGKLGETPMKEIWQTRFSQLRSCHEKSQWTGLCAGCREWHRA